MDLLFSMHAQPQNMPLRTQIESEEENHSQISAPKTQGHRSGGASAGTYPGTSSSTSASSINDLGNKTPKA